jgi:hypothetical protein
MEEGYMLRRTTAVFTAALVLGALAAPVAQAKGPSRKGGKKPIGTVASFDGTTLTVTMKDGTSQAATADDSTQVKLDHRGRPAAKGNPTRGDLDDLVAGALVLRMKTDDGALEKVRLRSVATESPAATCEADDCDDETDTEDSDDTEDADETDAEDSDDDEDDEDETEEEEEQDEDLEEVADEATEELPLP